MDGISEDTVIRMRHLAYGKHKLNIGEWFCPDTSDNTVNWGTVNRMMTALQIGYRSEGGGSG